jgi:hypothetical protein
MKFKVYYDDQPNDGVDRLASILKSQFEIVVNQLDGGDGFEEYEVEIPQSPLLNDDELKRLIWEEWESEIKEEDPRQMVFKYMKLMRSQFIK